MRPNWIKIGRTEKDLFDLLKLLKQGKSIEEIVKDDDSFTIKDIADLILRTSIYLKKHIVLDSYLETVSKFPHIEKSEYKLEWNKDELQELKNLYHSGATIINIAILMRKDKTEIIEKLKSIKLMQKGVKNG